MQMHLTRREFVCVSAAAVLGSSLAVAQTGLFAGSRATAKTKAVVFDAFPIFDPQSLSALAEELFPGKGSQLSDEWRNRQFEYAWLRVVARHYADFWHVANDSLVFASARLSLDLTRVKREKLMNAYLSLKTWPEVVASLEALKKAGIRLAILSNLTPEMLDSNIKSTGLSGIFEQILSTDRAKTYKPDPQAYQIGIDTLGLSRDEILFVAHAGWDAAGAKMFGYPTFWVNRQKLPVEQLGAVPDGQGESLSDLLKYIT
jgi:2-haloacid dehalogenase